MGAFTKLLQAIGLAKKKVQIICIGLDNSGKSTIINWLKPDQQDTADIPPTVGFNVEVFSKNKLQFTVFDMSGQGRYRNLWEHYYLDAEAIIFVIDAADKIRACVAKEELETMLKHKAIKDRNLPILFFANKMDIPDSMTPVDCSNALNLESIKDKPWQIIASNALTGQGLNQGLDWLADWD